MLRLLIGFDTLLVEKLSMLKTSKNIVLFIIVKFLPLFEKKFKVNLQVY